MRTQRLGQAKLERKTRTASVKLQDGFDGVSQTHSRAHQACAGGAALAQQIRAGTTWKGERVPGDGNEVRTGGIPVRVPGPIAVPVPGLPVGDPADPDASLHSVAGDSAAGEPKPLGQSGQSGDPYRDFHRGHERDWRFRGRSEQQPPEGDWRTWLILGGRGSGKTRAGAEWVHALASAGARSDLRIALVAETLGDAREVMIDGVSGICRIARRNCPDFEISRRRLVWPNGAVAQIFSSEDPEALRGPQFHHAWCDELHLSIVNE